MFFLVFDTQSITYLKPLFHYFCHPLYKKKHCLKKRFRALRAVQSTAQKIGAKCAQIPGFTTPTAAYRLYYPIASLQTLESAAFRSAISYIALFCRTLLLNIPYLRRISIDELHNLYILNSESVPPAVRRKRSRFCIVLKKSFRTHTSPAFC